MKRIHALLVASTLFLSGDTTQVRGQSPDPVCRLQAISLRPGDRADPTSIVHEVRFDFRPAVTTVSTRMAQNCPPPSARLAKYQVVRVARPDSLGWATVRADGSAVRDSINVTWRGTIDDPAVALDAVAAVLRPEYLVLDTMELAPGTPTPPPPPPPVVVPPVVVPPTPPVVVPPTPAPAPGDTLWRFLRWTVLARAGEANSVQAASFWVAGERGAFWPWPAAARVTNVGGNSPTGEGPSQLLDDRNETKWLDLNFSATRPSTLVFDWGSPMPRIVGYGYVTANDFPERDPVQWTLDRSTDGVRWVRIDSTRITPDARRHYTKSRPLVAEPPTAPPVVIVPTPPVAVPPVGVPPIAVPPIAEPPQLPPVSPPSCVGGPVGFAVTTANTARTERIEVRTSAGCLGIVTLGSTSRYQAHQRCGNAWVALLPMQPSRDAAVAQLNRACPATRAAR